MFGALLYLRLTSLQNRLLTQARRLRQPKYLLGAGFVVLYFWFFFFRHRVTPAQLVGGAGANPLGAIPHEIQALLLGLVSAGLLVLLGLMWLLPKDNPGLRFTEAEVAFLFPAPLTRRALLHFKGLSLLLGSLLQSLFFALIFSNRNLLHGHTVRTIVCWWVVLSFLGLHRLGATLTIARLSAAGMPARRRRLALLGGLAAVAAGLGWWWWRGLPAATAAVSLPDWLAGVFDSRPVWWLLLPVRTMLQPFFAPDTGAFLLALLPAGAILAAHYWWVVSMNIAFEEASVAQAERHAARLAEMRQTGTLRVGGQPRTGRKPPFDVTRTRWVELAFLWKNLLSTANGWLNARTWRIALALLLIGGFGLRAYLKTHYATFGGGIALLGAMTIGLALFYGPLLTRLDLRQDIANLDILRTYPLPGWRIVLGELLAPTAVLTGIIWLGVAAVCIGLAGSDPADWFTPGMKAVLVGCAAGLTPLVVALQLLVPNGAAMIFPAMFRVSQTVGGGLDQMGQRMLFGFGQMFVLFFIFVPALAVSGASYWVVRGGWQILAWLGAAGSPELSPAAAAIGLSAVFGVVVAGEIWCGVWWLGERFGKLDLTNDLRP